MRSARTPWWQESVNWWVLGALLVLTYGRLFAVPYKGFDADVGGRVLRIYVQGSPSDPLRPGDYLLQAGNMTWAQFRADDSAVMFGKPKAGETVLLVVERDGARRQIEWTYPGLNPGEFGRYALTTIWISYYFWVFGYITARHVRPRDETRTVAAAFYYVLAVGLAVGGDAAFSHIWFTAHLFRLAFWMTIPLALHFTWLWPSPLGKLPSGVKWTAYSAAFLGFVAKTAGLFPGDELMLGPAVAIGGILILLGLHVILQPASRRSVWSLLMMSGLAVLPVAAYPALEHRVSLGLNDLVTSLGLPLIPLAYTFAAYRRFPGTVEMRWNTVAVAYAFLFVSAIVMAPLVALISWQAIDQMATLGLAAVTGVLSALAGIFAYPYFKSFFERRVLGLPMATDELVGDYVSRITVAPSISGLTALLKESILQSLLVRQFLFVRLDTTEPETVLAVGISESEVPSAAELRQLAGRAGENQPARDGGLARTPWVRLVLTLSVEDEKLGMWLLGRRDPDDQYHEDEIAIIRSLADQTAIVFSHCLQTERLRELYQADVKRTEDERMELALALHDRVLNQLAALLMKMEGPSVTPDLLKLYEKFSSRVRNLVSKLRPPMLAYGLLTGLKELAETLQEQADPAVRISADGLVGEARYPAQVELHLYRIVQESCENALQHARASSIDISGRLDPDRASIQVKDDGAGFDAPDATALGRLIARRHYGLAGMLERANFIGGNIRIIAMPGAGTRVQVTWPQMGSDSGRGTQPSVADELEIRSA